MNERERNALDTAAGTGDAIRSHGLRQTVKEALTWIGREENLDPEGEQMQLAADGWIPPPVIPDGTRFRKCCIAHAPGRKTPCVELWEVVDTSDVTRHKRARIELWFLDWDTWDYPHFELWRVDAEGHNPKRLISTAEDLCGIKLKDL